MDEINEKIIALYEDARSEANVALWAIQLQINRLRSEDDSERSFALRPIADFHFLITALTRFQKMGRLALEQSGKAEKLEKFDRALPDLRKIRNVLEHLDEYRSGKGHNKDVSKNSLRTIVLGPEKIEWLSYELNLDEAIAISEVLFEEIKSNAPKEYLEKVKAVKQNQNNVGGT